MVGRLPYLLAIGGQTRVQIAILLEVPHTDTYESSTFNVGIEYYVLFL